MSCLLGLLRFTLCAWVGAATLFVITGIREVTSPLFEPGTKNQLAAVRFPAYYAVGFTLVGLAFLAALALRNRIQPASRGSLIVSILAIVVGLMVVDWFFVFQPLLDLMSLADAREKPEFKTYHDWSMYLNFASVVLCLVTGVIALRETQPNSSKDKLQ